MPDMLKKLGEERESSLQFINKLTDTALGESRDLSENELELIKRSQARIGDLDKQITVLSVESTLDDQAKERLALHSRGVVEPVGRGSTAVEYKSAGQYLRDYLGTIIGEGEFKAEATERLKRYHRAAAHITTGNFTGVLPDPIVGPVVDLINSSRPLVNALGTIAVPSGPSFRRPRLSDPNIGTGVGPQANQKDELVSQPFTMTSEVVNLQTLGGYVNVARQVIDWGVAPLDSIVNQLARRYSYATERMALAQIELSTSKVPLPSTATGAEVLAAIYDAAALVYTNTGDLPTVLAVGPLGWARLGGLSDAAGRPVFPFMGPSNSSGSQSATSFEGNPVGLRMVVTPAITDEDMWVLNSDGLEIYEQLVGQLSVVEPSVLGIQVAYAGYVGYYRPFPDGAVLIAP